MEGVEAGLIRELVISDGGSGDRTPAIARAAGARLVTGTPSRGGQLRRGARVAQGDWLLFLHADTVLAPGWSAAVSKPTWRRRRNARPAFACAFDVAGLRPALVAGWANLRTRLLGLPYGDQGLLLARAPLRRGGRLSRRAADGGRGAGPRLAPAAGAVAGHGPNKRREIRCRRLVAAGSS